MADETSRLLVNSKDFRTCAIAKNAKGYVPGKEYLPATPDTISDGDNRGRDPKTDGGSIGTKIDIDVRNKQMAKNADGYTFTDQYGASHPDTISDGDNRGRDPESQGGSIGTKIDIDVRNKQMAKNADGYTYGDEYGASHPDTISDGDCKGRDPESQGGSIGTNKDIEMRGRLMAKNTDGYTPTNQYCAGIADTIADGDDKGREPKQQGEEAGTCIDFASRICSLTKNSKLYTKNRQYGFGNGTV